MGLEVGRIRVRSGPAPKETEEKCVFVCFVESLSPRLRERKEDFWGVVWVVWSRREWVVELRDKMGDDDSLVGEVVGFIGERAPRGTTQRRLRVLRCCCGSIPRCEGQSDMHHRPVRLVVPNLDKASQLPNRPVFEQRGQLLYLSTLLRPLIFLSARVRPRCCANEKMGACAGRGMSPVSFPPFSRALTAL